MIIECEQKSERWWAARAGRVTGSEMGDVMDFVWKGSKERGDKRLVESAKRANYRAALVAEMLTGKPDMDGFFTRSMEWGELEEKGARAAYELRHGVMVEQVGFGIHDEIPRLGASPDGLIGDDGGAEFKNLKSKNHLEILKTDGIPAKFLPQIYTNIAVFNREWWDFVSYDSRFPQPELRLWERRVFRDESEIAKIKSAANQMLEEADAEVIWLIQRYGPFAIGQPEEQAEESPLGITDEDLPDWALQELRQSE